jgi:hypothetical protein
MASEETRQRAAACRDTSLAQYRNELIQCKVPLLADQIENLLRILLQRRRAPSAEHRLERSIFVKTLQPADRGTGADLKMFGRITSRSACFHELDHAYSQVSRIRSPHRSIPHRINALDSPSGGLWVSRLTLGGTRCSRLRASEACPRKTFVSPGNRLRYATSLEAKVGTNGSIRAPGADVVVRHERNPSGLRCAVPCLVPREAGRSPHSLPP